ncbi:MAG TPA: D-glycero-beta-D-manno-heptose-7-phosphate kinase [Pyrinomonadaceae bacterium]|nr:D-glycero-beta-D-manno-heptose-7-phosphate kinase [Pyrinomonadaceae bacterium]
MKSLQNFSRVKILVIGDLMLDRYWWGSVSRISPEAPVPIVHLNESTFAVGGAANVAANISGLGAKAYLVGIVGNDDESNLFKDGLKKVNVTDEYLLHSKNRPTIVKTRVIAHNQQVVRIDQEVVKRLDEEEERQLLQQIAALAEEIDLIICSDYAKGVLSDKILEKTIQIAKEKNKKVIVDPKGKNYQKYKGANLLTPNKKEAAEACKFDDHEKNWIFKGGQKLISEVDLEAILITQGEDGMTLIKNDGSSRHLHACARQIYDVTGAGDTVIATLGVALGAGNTLENASEIANIAAGLVVEQVGTTAIKFDDLKHYLEKAEL